MTENQTGFEDKSGNEKGQLNKDAKEFQPMAAARKLNAEAPEFVPGKGKLPLNFQSTQTRSPMSTSGNSCALSSTQLNIIKLIRSSGPNGILVDEIPEKYTEKFHVPIGDINLSKVLDQLLQYVHVMLAAKSDPKKSPSLNEGDQKFTLGHHRGKRVVDQYIYTMGEGVEEFRDMIVRVIREFCVRNMTRTDHPLTLATKGLLPAGANGVVRPTGLALSLFAAEWDRYFNNAEDFKSLREKYNVQKLMPFLLAIPELDIVGNHPEVRVRMRCMDECLEEAEKRAQTCTPEEISAMQSGATDKADAQNDVMMQPRKISIDPADSGSEKKAGAEFQPHPNPSFTSDQSLQYFHQQYAHAAMAAQAAPYQAMRAAGPAFHDTPASLAQAHAHAAMKFHYHQQMMQAAAATMAHSHAAAGGSIPITSEFFPTATSDNPYMHCSLGKLPRKVREEATSFPPLPPTNSSAYNPLAAKMQLMKSMNGGRAFNSSAMPKQQPSTSESKVSSPAVSASQNLPKSICLTPNLLGGDRADRSAVNSSGGGSAGNSALKGNGGLKLTPVVSEAPLPPAPGLTADGNELDLTGTQLADLAKLGIGFFDQRSPTASFFPESEACRSLGILTHGQGRAEDTTASVTPVTGSVKPCSTEQMCIPKLSPEKLENAPFQLAESGQPAAAAAASSLFPIVEPLDSDQQSATNYLQEIMKIMKEPLSNNQASDPNILADISQVIGNPSASLVGPPQVLPNVESSPVPEICSEAAAKLLLSMLQQQSAGQLMNINDSATALSSENFVSSLLGNFTDEDDATAKGLAGFNPAAGKSAPSPELDFDAEAVDKLSSDPRAGRSIPTGNGEYDRLTMLLVRAQMKHQLQDPPQEMKTLKTSYDPQYLKMKRTVAKAES